MYIGTYICNCRFLYISLDYKDTDTYIALVRLSLSLSEEYQVVRKDKNPPQKCFFEECYYTHWFRNIPTGPIVYMSKSNLHYNQKSTMVFLASSPNLEGIEFCLKEISQRDLLSTVLIMTRAVTIDEKEMVENRFNEMNENVMFFWLYNNYIENQNMMVWNRVIGLKGYDKAIVNKVEMNNQSRIKEEYDLQGLHLTSMSLSWFPYFHLFNCNNQGMSCESTGYLKQFMDSLGTLLNFTWESHREVDDNWGLVPQAGGGWDGVVGHVFNGTYQLSIRYTYIE